MHILFIMDPLESINLKTDTTWVLMLEAQKRRHKVYYCTVDDLYIKNTKPCAEMHEVDMADTREVNKLPRQHFTIKKTATKCLEDMNVVFMRKDPPFNMNFFFATSLLALVDTKKTLIINRPEALLTSNEKLYALNFSEFTPQTIVTKRHSLIKKFVHKHEEAVLKPLNAAGGHGVFHLKKNDKNLNPLLEIMTNHEKRFVMVQKYLPQIAKGDKRIILFNGKPLGAVLRVPSKEDHRGNIHAGSRSRKTKITLREQKMCAKIGKELRRKGLYLVGIDVIGGKLTEINVTSPTLFQEINALNGTRLEERVLSFVERTI